MSAVTHMVVYSTKPRGRMFVAHHARHTLAASLLVGAWSVGEATFWPIMPDAVLVPLAFARPGDWWRLVLAAAGGTAFGGVTTYLAGRRRPGSGSRRHLPLVQPRMVTAARGWLRAEGARGVWRQPVSGVPIKVFAREAGALGIPLVPFLAWAVGARAARFALAAGGAALARHWMPRAVATHPALLLAGWCVVFGLGLWRTVVAWSGPSDETTSRV